MVSVKKSCSIPFSCAFLVTSRDTSSEHEYPRSVNSLINDVFPVPGPPVKTMRLLLKSGIILAVKFVIKMRIKSIFVIP